MSSEYTVKSGDTLSAIAQRHQTTLSSLLRLNPDIDNPDRIFPGQRLKLPAANDADFSNCEVGQIAQEPPCAEEIVDVVHVTGSDELILLTEEELSEWLEEEEFVCGPINEFYERLDGLNDGDEDSELSPTDGEGQLLSEVQEEKERLVEELEARSVLTNDMQSIPPITEIKRLAGNRHVTFVRSDKMKNHQRRYSIAARDRARSDGWLTENGVDPAKLRDAIRSELNIKFNAKLWEPDQNGALMTTLNKFYDEASWSIWGDAEARQKAIDETGFDASAEAQFMRFAAGGSASGEFDPRKGKVHLQAKAEGQYSLAQGKVGVEQSYPVNNRSEVIVYYRVGGWDGERKEVSLGHFQARLRASLSGFAGASALLAANVTVDSSNGIPNLKGVAARQHGQGAAVDAGVFAGVRAGCELSGALLWTDVLSTQADWKTLCEIGKKVEAAAGIGGELRLRLEFSENTGKFYFNFHAGVVLGVGASGSFVLEVDPKNIVTMVHYVYKALADADFRYLELFGNETKAFDWYTRIAIYAIGTGANFSVAAVQVAERGAIAVLDFMDNLGGALQSNFERERLGREIADNLIADHARGSESVLRHSPPEVKAKLLYLLIDDFWLTPKLLDGTYTKVKAVSLILESMQSWRDFEETMVRINPENEPIKSKFEENVRNVFNFIGKNMNHYDLFQRILKGTTATLVGPVRSDPFSACKVSGIV
ncbi:LysM peptidoglycan-binding domain-containing protein [Marinobacter daepoensis]|uniref:LysM peptidoglycan-binding domain-containing protein n=1 Tax=Marinobacter daepoensis TaxID=262077 RepID=A0ABS3BIG6_9GAMM|nr:LysM domain-containing protein [Marinobacter daepoensis]MBN7771624.1 LysM peptidoglycan-binding domain-containing protein [Marinobacter daepoensis]MBY6080923.1 LysM peptidoglycan-binding domain-containing protein [Marinobacter daepoensis]